MKVIAKQNRDLIMINAQNTQNENDAEKIILQVPEKYEDFAKKIVFVTPDGVVWDYIENNEYLIKRAITKYEQVKFYIWLTKDDVDFRTQEKTLKFNVNHKVEGEVTPEEESDIERIISILDTEIIKVENLDIDVTKIEDTTTVTITKKDGTQKEVEIYDGHEGKDGKDGYTPIKGIDYFTPEEVEEVEEAAASKVIVPTKTSQLTNDSGFVMNTTSDLLNYELKTNTGSNIALSVNPSTYVMTFQLKNSANTVISSATADLPLESVVVNGSYDTTTKKIVLTLQNGNTIEFSVADLVEGLQSEITVNNKLDSGLVDDSNSNNKFVTPTQVQTWSNQYTKPNTGIPKSDLSSDVQTSLGKADTALQQHQDITGKEDKSNKVTSISDESTDEEYPSAKTVYDSQEIQNVEILDLQERLRDAENNQLTGPANGTSIDLEDSADARVRSIELEGNSAQETTEGYNLMNFDVNGQPNGITVNDDGSVTINRTAGGVSMKMKPITIEANQTYKQKIEVISGTMTDISTGEVIETGGLMSFSGNAWLTPTEYVTYMPTANVDKSAVWLNQGRSFNNYRVKIWGYKGTDDKVWERGTDGPSPNPSYPQPIYSAGDNETISVTIENENGTQSQTYTIPCQQPMKSIENESIGTVRDYFFKNVQGSEYYDNTLTENVWYERHLMGNILINGTQGTISKPSTNRFNIDNAIIDYLKAYNKINYVSNQYISYSQQGNNAGFDALVSNVNYGLDLSSGSTAYTIRIKDTRYNDIDDFKTWLSNNNLKIIYVLATPNDLLCTEEQTQALEEYVKSKTYKNVTHIYSEDNVSPYQEIVYVKDTESGINELIDAQIGDAIGGAY